MDETQPQPKRARLPAKSLQIAGLAGLILIGVAAWLIFNPFKAPKGSTTIDLEGNQPVKVAETGLTARLLETGNPGIQLVEISDNSGICPTRIVTVEDGQISDQTSSLYICMDKTYQVKVSDGLIPGEPGKLQILLEPVKR